MKRIFRLLFPLLWCFPCVAQLPVTPIVQPHMTFLDTNGLACAGCSLNTYAAGSTTPQATYTDSTGTSQNTNPVIMGADGGPLTPSGSSGGIWLGTNAYKLVLVDAGGTTVWTADNVNAGNVFPCTTAAAIQIANSATTGLTCDPTITINTAAHLINVGTLGAAHVTIGALGTPTSWTFDTTTPATALASLGGGSVVAGTINQIAIYAANGATVSGSTNIPNGITASTQSPSDNTANLATTRYVAAPGAISPTSLQIAGGNAMTANQGTGASVQHSTGATTTNDCAKFDATGNTVDAGGACVTVTTPRTCNSNGCYQVFGDGTITQSGNVAGCATSNDSCNVSVTFPIPFTSITNVVITTGVTGWQNCLGNPFSKSTSGFTMSFSPAIVTGGSGANCPGTQTGNWIAIGN